MNRPVAIDGYAIVGKGTYGGKYVSYCQVLQDMTTRDEWDKNRATNPLAPAPDAIIISTSTLIIDAALCLMQ